MLGKGGYYRGNLKKKKKGLATFYRRKRFHAAVDLEKI